MVEDQTELICRFLRRRDVDVRERRLLPLFPTPGEGAARPDLLVPDTAGEPPRDARASLASITPDHPVATAEHEVLAPNGERPLAALAQPRILRRARPRRRVPGGRPATSPSASTPRKPCRASPTRPARAGRRTDRLDRARAQPAARRNPQQLPRPPSCFWPRNPRRWMKYGRSSPTSARMTCARATSSITSAHCCASASCRCFRSISTRLPTRSRGSPYQTPAAAASWSKRSLPRRFPRFAATGSISSKSCSTFFSTAWTP